MSELTPEERAYIINEVGLYEHYHTIEAGFVLEWLRDFEDTIRKQEAERAALLAVLSSLLDVSEDVWLAWRTKVLAPKPENASTTELERLPKTMDAFWQVQAEVRRELNKARALVGSGEEEGQGLDRRA